MKTLVIYHRADFDGIASGEICRKFLACSGDDPVLVGWDYGDPVPDVAGYGRIYLVDISVAELLDDEALNSKIVWIDHHQTAIARWGKSNFPGLQMDGVAACRLCWQWFMATGPFPAKEDYIERRVKEPLMVRMLGEFDVWDRRDPDCWALQLGLRSAPFRWDEGLQMTDVELVLLRVKAGRIIAGYLKRTNAALIRENGRKVRWRGINFLVFNGHGNSLVFDAGLADDVDACLLWNHDGRKVAVSLYGVPRRPDLDLSEIALELGGGGHRQACGFEADLRWIDDLMNCRPFNTNDSSQ